MSAKFVGRAHASGIVLDEEDAAVVRGMLRRGDRQHDIAAWFGVNGGRIAEISTGSRFWWVPASPAEELPPMGPYPAGKIAIAALNAIAAARSALANAEAVMKKMAA